jgi:hypothetical protein
VELGVKLRSDVAGSVTGIRFYKGSTNTGTHTGSLWTSTGTLLARATFTNETASGWQQVSFATPVTIAANTTYVASYFAPAGHYALNGAYFASSGADNGPLHALASGVDGSNGVYAYSSTSAFPTQSFNTSNYWVDVVFSAAASPPPTPTRTPPAVPSSPTPPAATSTPVRTPTTTPPGSGTIIDDSVQGSGTNQVNYVGANWRHCTSCGAELYNQSNSWNGTANQSLTVTFNGTQLNFYGVVDAHHGIGMVSIDGGPETSIDFYRATRAGNVRLWSSPVLAAGTHTFRLRVTGTKNASSSGTMVAIDRVEVVP